MCCAEVIKRIESLRVIILLLLLWEGGQGDSAWFQEGHGEERGWGGGEGGGTSSPPSLSPRS